MGRRKIEIQPITHERNRSVTFLKRKNGLFKKAYELGVLCSVDVAVIIFEERPGHHVKLYQYGSSDIHDIVQRHMRHDGEKDTRGPPDFSNASASKLDDIGDGDDDDGDDDDDLPARNKRRHDGKLKPPPDMVTSNMDYTSPGHRSLSIPQPPPLSLHIGGQSASGGSTLPISNDRSIGMRDTTKRSSRLSLHPGHSRSPSDSVDQGSGNYPYYSGQSSGAFNRPPQYGHHPAQHHSHSQSGPPHHGSSTQYQPFFPVSSSHQSPPPSFIPLQSDFSRGPPSSRGGGSGFGLPPRSSSTSSASYDPPGMYSNMMRNPPPSSQPSGHGGGPGPSSDLFSVFLDAEEQQNRHQNQAQQGSGLVSLEWPVHNSSAGGNSASSAPSVPSSSVSNNQSAAPSSAHPEGPANGNWLDFLSNNNNSNSNSSHAPSGRDSLSWERGGAGGDRRGEMSEIFGGEHARAGSSTSTGSGLVMGISSSSKRAKEEDVSLGINIPSPGMNSRTGDAQKEAGKDGS